jgi:OFA family oxalate/formate antiporter-like MFS transporter
MTTSSDRLLGIPEAPSVSGRRWLQLVLGLICMMAISSPQYVWALMTKPMTSALGVSLPQLQVTFSLLIVCQTFLSPLQGLLIERFGPRWLLSLGGLLTGLSWILAARATDLPHLYVTYGILGGIGTGIIYVGIVGHMVQWFPDRRGFATGMVAAGYGMGAVVTTFPISASIASAGYQQTLLHFGLVLGAVAVLAAQGMRRAPADWMARRSDQGPRATDAGPSVVLRSPVFWLMFLMFTMMSTSGLMVISQMGAFARDFGVSSATVLGVAALPLALTLDRLTNGLTRPFFGWVSDHIGREPTMLLAFAFEGVAMTLWLVNRGNPTLFVLLSGVAFFGWGEIFSLFPSTLTDTFGKRHATTNYGWLYMAQGVGSIFGGPLAAWMHEATGSWVTVFATVIALDFATALLAIAVLRPLRARLLARTA